MNYAMMPSNISNLLSWILWKLEKREGKYTKTPYQKNGKMAKVNDKNTWDRLNNIINKDGFSGIGFVFNMDHNIIGIDIDHCIENGKINDEAEYWIKRFNSYTEISQSGTGIHILVEMDKQELKKYVQETYGTETGLKRKLGECYFTGRYFAMTGNIFNNLNQIKSTKLSYIKDFLEYITQDSKPIEKIEPANIKNTGISTLADSEIISLATKYNNNFQYLYNEMGQKGNSEGDQSLINILAFYTKDAGQIKRMMLNSSRMRAKFTKHPTYLNRSIQKGLQIVTAKYDPESYKKNNPNNKKTNINKPDKKNVTIKKPVEDLILKYNKFKGEKSFKNKYDLSISCDYYNLAANWGEGYYLTNKGFIQRLINKEDCYADKLITPIQLIPQELIYLEGKEELLLNVRNGENEEKSIFKTEKMFSSAINFRIFLNSNLKTSNWFDGSIKDVTGYDKYLAGLIKSMNLKRRKASSKLGWIDNEFLPYSNKILLCNDGVTEKKIIEKLTQKGSFSKWTEYIIENMKNDVFRMYINVSLASPLIDLLKLQGFGFYNYSPPNRGKTNAVYSAWSIWGKPDKYTVPAFNVSRAGVESRLNMLNNLPGIFDDSQQLTNVNKQQIDKLIYDMANGSGRTRMTKEAKNGAINAWELTFILTGERELLNNRVDSGAHKRLLEIEGIPSDDKKMSRETKIVVCNNYGFLGPLFIEFLNKNRVSLLEALNNFEDKLENDKNIEAHITHMALLTLCDHIMGKILKIEKNDSFLWSKRILNRLPTKRSIDKMENGLELIREIYLSNPSRFDIDSKVTKLGFKNEDGICFYRNELIKILKENDIPEKQFLKYIKKENIVSLDNNDNFKVIKHNGSSIRPIQFLNSFFEDDIEFQGELPNIFDNLPDRENS